jgi:hypothetical protein
MCHKNKGKEKRKGLKDRGGSGEEEGGQKMREKNRKSAYPHFSKENVGQDHFSSISRRYNHCSL